MGKKNVAITVDADGVVQEIIPVFRGFNKFGVAYRPVSLNRQKFDGLNEDGQEIGDPTPNTIPVRLPTMEQRVARFELAGQIRQDYYDDLLEDDFQDEFDDIPPEGLSPYEESTSYDRHNDRKKPTPPKSSKKPQDTPSPEEPRLPLEGGEA